MKITCMAVATILSLQATYLQAASEDELHWYRCNTHTHTSARPNSDANGTPGFVVDWYKSHGYQCLVITDHEYLTDVAPLNAGADDGEFLVIQGQEITQTVRDSTHPHGIRHAHMNGINTSAVILPEGYPDAPPETSSLTAVYQRNLAAIKKAGGIPQVNHPNLHWSVRLDDLMPLEGPFLMEIWNAFPSSNNLGGSNGSAETPSTEMLWDQLLSRGKVVWAVGSDDVHDYVNLDDREAPTPGKAWIVVRAPALSVTDITDAIKDGNFYASTGVNIEDYAVTEDAISIKLKPLNNWNSDQPLLTRYTTRFIGVGGTVLDEVHGSEVVYHFTGDEQYVRASITDSDGHGAWTQPVFRDRRTTGKSLAE
jgi:hypothetical protein